MAMTPIRDAAADVTTGLTTELRAAAEASVERVAALIAEVALVAAPSNEEAERARFIADRLRSMGYEPEIDAISNVLVRRGSRADRPC